MGARRSRFYISPVIGHSIERGLESAFYSFMTFPKTGQSGTRYLRVQVARWLSG